MLSEEYPEWKALLTELLADIAKRLTSIADYTSFRGVCGSWRSAATLDNFDRDIPQAPLLLYCLKEREETPVLGDEVSEETPIHEKIVTKFLDLETNTSKIANLPRPALFPSMYLPYLSCSGWVLVSNDTQVSLIHFMLGISIKLPSLNILFISKMVLSGSPMEPGLVVMVICGDDDQLAFCRPGDECWTEMDWWEYGNFDDITYHDRKLYALGSRFTIFECDIHGSNPTKIEEVFTIPSDVYFKFPGVLREFLVESFGKFMLVLHYYISRNESYHFRVFEIELKDGSYDEIHNIGDRCIILGFNSSICVSSSSVGLKPNCIYFSKPKSCSWEPYVGIYTLGGGGNGNGNGYLENFSDMFDFCFPPPLWVVPSI